ncbi:M48 family peptidase [Methanosarcina sp. MSH10X1]|uniref:M48 family metallopeptidase n=1 Tax=Methanosarcina sp. MSH10X1 TaxID=2507075 RepID=UPI000FFC2B73|nr:M48 family metallopeptidase [Methanosarcina sp. MSH10X1]RXA19973.1 M48 family peptidase [Methanosarcina sp. MSH10X1]
MLENEIKYLRHPAEIPLFIICLLVSILIYVTLMAVPVLYPEELGPEYILVVPAAIAFLSFVSGQTYGGMMANAIRLSEKQFPELYEVIKRLSFELNLREVPDAFLIQEGGLINAFATRLYFRKNYVVFYADVVEVAYREGDFDSLEFIVAHELAHIKAGHVTLLYNLSIFPIAFVPVLKNLLWTALSRAREYTSDRIADRLVPSGKKGLIVLSAGEHLYKAVNYEEYLETARSPEGFWIWSTNLFSTHPALVRRVRALNENTPGKIF